MIRQIFNTSLWSIYKRRRGRRVVIAKAPLKIMDLSKFKKLALVAVASGLATQPVSATESQTVAEDNYYVASCGGQSCGNRGYPTPYNQTNPAPVAMDDQNSTGGKIIRPGDDQATDPAKKGAQPAASPKGSTTSRYYQKRDRDVADNAPNFAPSNGLLPDQQKSGSNKSKMTTGSSSSTNSSSSMSGSPNSSSNLNSSGR